jgi:hypothetical protein
MRAAAVLLALIGARVVVTPEEWETNFVASMLHKR